MSDHGTTHDCPSEDYGEEDEYGGAFCSLEYRTRRSPHGRPRIAQVFVEGWYATNNEYATRVRFCPFCGYDLVLMEAHPLNK